MADEAALEEALEPESEAISGATLSWHSAGLTSLAPDGRTDARTNGGPRFARAAALAGRPELELLTSQTRPYHCSLLSPDAKLPVSGVPLWKK